MSLQKFPNHSSPAEIKTFGHKYHSVGGNGENDKENRYSADDEDEMGDDEPPQVSCDLDPDSVFDMTYLKSDDHTLSSQFIMNSKSFKEGLKTYDVTHIIE